MAETSHEKVFRGTCNLDAQKVEEINPHDPLAVATVLQAGIEILRDARSKHIGDGSSEQRIEVLERLIAATFNPKSAQTVYLDASSLARCRDLKATFPDPDPSALSALSGLLAQRRPATGPVNLSSLENGAVQLTFPALASLNQYGVEFYSGTAHKLFSSLQEAEAVAATTTQRITDDFEIARVRKLAALHGLPITVNGPADQVSVSILESQAAHSNSRSASGNTSEISGPWSVVREVVFEYLDQRAGLSKTNLLCLPIEANTVVGFSNFANFTPTAQLAGSPTRLSSPFIEEYLRSRQRWTADVLNFSTYANTVREAGWESNLYSFVDKYLNGPGAQIKEDLGIKDLRLLSPRQAASLSSRIVADLTKYKYSDIGFLSPTTADKSSVLEILQEGLTNRDNPQWEGNAVCRNIASAVKAVFEALKVSQGKLNLLQGMYCTLEGGAEYAPEMHGSDTVQLKQGPGHAWNSFISSNGTQFDMTIVDVTWSVSRSGDDARFDYTLKRIESMVFDIATLRGKDEYANEFVQNVFGYYDKAFEEAGEMRAKETSVRFPVERLLELQERFSATFSPALARRISTLISMKPELIEEHHIERLRNGLRGKHDALFRATLKAFVKLHLERSSKPPSHFSDELQREVIDALFTMDELDSALKHPEFRVRVRALEPALLSDFDPIGNVDDLTELYALSYISGVDMLPTLTFVLPQKMNAIASAKNGVNLITHEKLGIFFSKVREFILQGAGNREAAVELLNRQSDYDVLKNFAQLRALVKRPPTSME